MGKNGVLPEASIVADREFWRLFLCREFIESINSGKKGENLKVFYTPDEVAAVKIEDEIIFYVPIVLLNGPKCDEKRWVPIFMLVLSADQKYDLKKIGRKKGLKVFEKHFFKPSLTIYYEAKDELLEVN